MTASRRRALVVGGLAAIAALGASPASASEDELVAAGPNGSVSFVVQETGAVYGGVQLIERTLGGDDVLGEAQSVSPAYQSAYSTAIGVDAAGNAVITFTSSDGTENVLYARRRAADGSLGPNQRLSPAGANVTFPRLAVEPDGDAVAAWVRTLNGYAVVQARRRAANGALGPVRTLSYAAAHVTGAPDVEVAPNGAATVAWLRRAPEAKAYVQTRTIAPDGSLSATQNLTAAGKVTEGPRVTMSDAGAAVFAWIRDSFVQSRARSASGVLGVTQTISSTDRFEGAEWLDTAGDAAGRTAYVWNATDGVDDSGHPKLEGRVRQADGTLSPRFELAEYASDGQVAFDGGGNVTFAWHKNGTSHWVMARRRTAAGTLDPVRAMSNYNPEGWHPRLAVDSAGKATVAWRSDYFGPDVYARSVTPAGAFSAIHRIDGDA